MNALSRRAVLLLLGLVAGTIVSAEVLFTRLLSVSTWYGLAFVVLSLAMLGLASGSLDAAKAQREGAPLAPWIAQRLLAMCAGLVLATVVLCAVPVSFAPNLTAFGGLVLVVVVVALPLVAGSAVVARLMAEGAVPLARLYAVDLTAAALGALSPLVLLGPLSGPGALLVLAAAMGGASAWAADAGPARGLARAVTGLCLGLLLVTQATPRAGLFVRYPKGQLRPDDEVAVFEAWNPLSHVYVTDFRPVPFRSLWSPSPRTPEGTHRAANARIDGEAATPIYAYRRPQELNVLRFDATTSAHALRPDGTACVIGVGGGRDLVSALNAGHPRVLGVEINPAMVAMLGRLAEQSPTLRDPRVHVRVGDGRAVYAASDVHCTVLQASLVDTWAATTAGAFAHTESTLYTREAWAVFLRRVAPEGVVTFSRWYDPRRASETSRLVSLAVASLLDRGVTDARPHIALIGSGVVATILVSPSPFTDTDLAALRDLETRLAFRILVMPGRAAAHPLLDRILATRSVDALGALGRADNLDTSAPTDDRPFFFQLMAPRAWLHPMRALDAARGSSGVLAGNATAMFELIVTFIATSLLALALLGPTLARAAREASPPLPGARAGVYFGALGAGFMLAEIALVQRLHVVLGHPTYALVVVLAGLLVATGLGSALSPRVIASRRAVRLAALGTAALLALLPHVVIRPLAALTTDGQFWVRVLWSGATAGLVGMCLGVFFPSGVRYLDRARGASVALAINGATSVLGSVLAIVLSVWFGIAASFAGAACFYALAAWAAPVAWRPVDDATA